MIHQRQHLALSFKSGDDHLGVHAQLDHLERDAAAHRLALPGDVHHAKVGFSDLTTSTARYGNSVTGASFRISDERCWRQ